MKKIVIIMITAAAVLTIMFTGCQNPLNPSVLDDEISGSTSGGAITGPSGEITTGVKFTIPRYASWIGTAAQSRAYGFTDSIEVTVYNSKSSEVYNESFSPSMSGSISCEVVLSPDTGYTAAVDIYNHVMSTTVPVVSGTSESFDISEGVVTQVPVICIPVNPVTAGVDTEYDFSGTATVIGGEGYPISSGTEFWYVMTAPESGYILVDIDVPQDIVFFYAAFNSAGEAAFGFGDDVGGPGPETLGFAVTPSEIYYFALVCADSSANTINGSLSWSEAVVTALTDDDVPDPWLRACLEDEAGGGREFITDLNPEPAVPITDMDLAMLTYLDAYISGNSEPVVISDLTGLEYCSNITDLYLDDADLSGCDLTEGGTSAIQLEGMDALNWLRLCYTELDSLDFISGLSGLSGLYVRDNPALDYYDFTVLTSENFPNLEYLYLSGWDLDSDGDIDEDDYFTGEYWSDIMAILRPFSGLRSLEIRKFWEGDADFARLFNSGEVLDTNAGTLGSLFVSDNNLTEASLTYIATLSGLGHLNMENNAGIDDISVLTALTGLEHLDLSCTGVKDLSPLQTLYNAGAFHNHFDYDEIDITLNGCGLDLWEGTDNRAVVDYLIAGGVRVSYEYGNYLEEPGVVLTEEDVPDANLRAAFEDATGKVFGELTDKDCRDLTQLVVDNAGISDLTGIEYCEGIYFLLLNNNPVSDLTPLAALQDDNLNAIDMYGCDVSDLTPLLGFTNLMHLKLMDNPLEMDDFQILTPTNFPALIRLHIDGWDEDLSQHITDADQITTLISAFSSMDDIGLASFGLDDDDFQVLMDSVLSASTGTLHHLHLYQNELTDLSFGQLSGFTELQTLNIFGNANLTDISFMAGMTQMEYLSLGYNRIGDISILDDLYIAGAFRTEDWRYIDIQANGMLIWESTANYDVVEYLTIQDVPVNYEYGNFTEPVATYTSISPESGPAGTTVTLEGEGFETQAEKHLVFEWFHYPDGGAVGGVVINSWSDTEIVFTVPSAPADSYGVQALDLSETSDHRGTHYLNFTLTE